MLVLRDRRFQVTLGAIVLVVLTVVIYFCLEKTVIIKDDDRVIKGTTFKRTVAEVLEEKGIKLHEKDLVKPGLQTRLQEGQVIKITRAFPVVVMADGKSIEIVNPPVKVAAVLREAGVTLGEKDIVSAKPDSITYKGQVIKVTRVEEKIVVEKTKIPFRKVSVADAMLEKGLTRTVTRGRPGLAQETLKIVYYDGKEVRREVLKVDVIKKPVNQVVAMGTITSVSRGNLRLDFSRALLATATAYTYTGRHTATGLHPEVGMVAVDPSVIPLGSRLYIEGYGFARAADIGSAIKGNRLDVFLESLSECKKWGRRQVKVYLLK